MPDLNLTGTAYIEHQVQQERAEESRYADARFVPPTMTDREFLIAGAERLLEVCDKALKHLPESEYDEEGERVLAPLVIPHELAMDLYSAVRWAKGFKS